MNQLSQKLLLLHKNNDINNNIEENTDYETSDDEKIQIPINNNNFLFINGSINDNNMDFFLNTSSKKSYISTDNINKCQLQQYVQGNSIHIQVIFNNNIIQYLDFEISKEYNIIGTDMMKILGIVIDFSTETIKF
jgi:hypothetical protein